MALISKVFFASQNPLNPRHRSSNIKNPRITSLFTTPDRKIVKAQSIIFPGEANKTESFRVTKLEEFRGKLKEVGEAPSVESLLMIDAVQRLGIDYHFRDEIEELLGKQYLILSKGGYIGKGLHEVALRFRLLRQQGYNVSAGIFDEFKDKEGRFCYNQNNNDIRGLIELYEASHLRIEGENILDDAGQFSAQHLKAWSKHINHSQSSMVQNTLNHPYHKSVPRFTAKKLFHENSQGSMNEWIHILQELAKMDFDMNQPLYQQEMHRISIWWEDLGLTKELQFARNQPLKWYIWSLSSLTDPTLSEQRIELTKPISLIYMIDDIFDVYGTLDELTLFTDVVNRWDYDDNIKQLPDYMKTCFRALNDITNEISFKVYKKYGWNPVQSPRKTWTSLCNAFLVEARWFASGEQPSLHEYLKNGTISSGIHVVLVHIFFLLGEGLTRETVEIIDNNPGIISAVATILRLWDDLGTAKDEDQDGKDGSYVDCYMKEHQDLTVEEARNHVHQIISKAWKQLNQECLSPNPFSSHFTDASLNLARMVPVMYGYDENHRLPGLEDYIKSLLYELS